MPTHSADTDAKTGSNLFISISTYEKLYDFFISLSYFNAIWFKLVMVFKYEQKLTSAMYVV